MTIALSTAEDKRTDAERAAAFLAAVAGSGPVAVCAMVPDERGVVGRIFDLPAEESVAAMWLADRRDGCNLYYGINGPRAGAADGSGRVKEAYIETIRAVVVDIDPNREAEQEPGGYKAERQRLLGIAAEWREHPVWPATFIVDTGNGIQLGWRLEPPLPATQENQAAAKAQAAGMAARFGGDAVQSLDHLFRLPHTINHPDERKRKRGRVRSETRLLSLDAGARYSLAGLAQIAPPIKPAAAAPAIELDYLPVLEILDDPEKLPEHLLSTAAELVASAGVQTLLENSDRSARDFGVVCAAIRAGIKDPTDLACILAAVSPEKLQEKEDQDRGEQYVARTVARALEKAERPTDAAAAFDALVDEADAGDGDATSAAPHVTSAAPQASAGAGGTAGQLFGATPPKAKPKEIIPVFEGVVVRARPDPATIPVREWLVEPRLPMGDVSLLIGEPGVSKSTFAIRDAIAVAAERKDILEGRVSLGFERLHQGGPVIVHNGEDRVDELRRRVTAAMHQYGVEELVHPIYLLSGVDEAPLVIARRDGETARAPLKAAPGYQGLVEFIRRAKAVLVVLDPLVSLASNASENDNSDMDVLLGLLARLAARLNVAVSLVHHTAKSTRDAAGDMGAARGAFAIVGKVRAAVTLTNVSTDDAKAWGITGPNLIRMDFAKTSHGRKPGSPVILRRLDVPVGNGRGLADGAGFELTPRQSLEAIGDTAPVLEVVGLGKADAQAQRALDERSADKRRLVAEAVVEVIGCPAERRLGEVWAEIGGRLNRAGVTKSLSRNVVTDHIKVALAACMATAIQGQHILVSAVQTGVGDKSPWLLKTEIASADRALEALEGEAPLQDLQACYR